MMKTVKKEIKVGQTILLNGETFYVEDTDGSFFYLEGSDESIQHGAIVEVVVSNSTVLEEQYMNIANAIECDGLGYAVLHGYITPDMTDDDDLKDAIRMAIKGNEKIMGIVGPYLP